jgi:hypothetical protein
MSISRFSTAVGIVALAAMVFVGSGIAAQEFDEKSQQEIDALILQLGAAEFKDREAAIQALIRLGEPARGALTEASSQPDPEVRSRCRQVLAILDRDRQALLLRQLHDKLRQFEDGRSVDLRGSDRYRRIVGSDQRARSWFARLARADLELLLDYQGSAKNAGRRIEQFVADYRLTRHNNQNARLAPPVVMPDMLAAIYFVAADPEVPCSTQVLQYLGFFGNEFIDEEGELPEPLMALATHWTCRALREMVRPESDELRQHFCLALKHDMQAVVQPALDVLKDGKASPEARLFMIHLVRRFGDGRHQAVFKDLLNDSEKVLDYVKPSKEVITIQVRDAALQALLSMEGKRIADYGFDIVESNDDWGHVLAGFPDNATRERAFERWSK